MTSTDPDLYQVVSGIVVDRANRDVNPTCFKCGIALTGTELFFLLCNRCDDEVWDWDNADYPDEAA